MTKIFKRTSLILALFLILSLLIACGKLFYRQPAIEPLSYSFIYTPPHATPSLPMDVTIGVLEPNTSINFQHNRETMGIKGVATGDEQLKAQLAYNAYWSALEKDEKASQVLSDFYNKIKEDFTEILKPQKSFSYFSQISLAERRDTLIVFSPAIELSIDTVKLTTFEDKGGTTKGVVLRLQEKMSIESKITLTAYEALTEKEILRLDGNTHKSGEESFFSDSLAKSFKYEFIRIVISTYPNVLGKGLSSLYPELMQEQWDTITSEWLQDVVAKARLIREEAVPSFPSPSYRFVYEAPSQKAQTTSIATAIIEFKPLVELQVAGSEPARIAKEFAEAVQKDFSSVLHNRGIQVLQQSLKSIDDMVYADKKSAYFVLTPEIVFSLTSKSPSSKQVGPLSTSNGSITLTGTVSISLVEPFSKQKLLFKQIDIPSLTESITIVEYQKGSETATLADSRPNAVAKLLETVYQQLFGKLFQMLNPEDLANMKSQVNEIRGKLGFPALP